MIDTSSADTVSGLLSLQAQIRGHAPALIDADRQDVSYAALHREVARFGALLTGIGLGRRSRIAMAMPTGPDTAVVMLATMSVAVCAPLDPSLEPAACSALLAAMRVDALLAAKGERVPAVASANSLGVPIVWFARSLDDAGAMLLVDADAVRAHGAAEPPRAGDLALLLHTSGTMAEPKIVPLTHEQLLARARHNPFVDADRGICAAPLFTATAIEACLLSTLAAGASVSFARPDAERLVEQIARLRATYLWASPAVYASMVSALAERRVPAPSLRFLRAGSSALSAELQAKLEAAFHVPVLQGYGMTETGVIARNALPPGEQRAGSVGKPLASRVRIATDDGVSVPAGEIGEIVVQGPGVTTGYEQSDANRVVFRDGWFRTGDLGYFDGDGFLFITGRLGETINRGGRQVSPLDIDSALARHPAVLDAAAFALPHPSLGEDVAAAVVLREPCTVTARELRAFAFDHLAPFKVPSLIVIVDQLPTNALGKVQRKALADALQASLRARFVSPRDADEHLVARVFAEVLGRERVGSLDNFFELGGDSLTGARVIGSLNSACAVELPVATLFTMPTVAELAGALSAARRVEGPPDVPVRPR
jgi:acyl-CoA synthetase (AMP-forming)/AMP-acid ligase II/acyl carrier protein